MAMAWGWAVLSVVVSLHVRRDIVLLADEMVRYGMASSRDEALRLLLEAGVEVVRRELERRKRVEELVERFERQGGIRLGGRVDVVSELREIRG